MNNQHYRSVICDRACGHRHRTPKTAEDCVSYRIRQGELQRYLGEKATPETDLAFYVSAYHKDGLRVGG